MNKGKLVDTTRMFISPPKNVFTWWSYRSKDFKKNNRGRRLDHIWTSPILINKVQNIEILKKVRSWKKPSDHVPIIIDLNI